MKKINFAFNVLFLLSFQCLYTLGQQGSANEETIKTGWNVGALPVVAFDTDIGFKYGALVNLFHYGDGSQYPKYRHSLFFEWSRTTKGSGINQFTYDSEYLIPGIRVSAEVSQNIVSNYAKF